MAELSTPADVTNIGGVVAHEWFVIEYTPTDQRLTAMRISPGRGEYDTLLLIRANGTIYSLRVADLTPAHWEFVRYLTEDETVSITGGQTPPLAPAPARAKPANARPPETTTSGRPARRSKAEETKPKHVGNDVETAARHDEAVDRSRPPAWLTQMETNRYNYRPMPEGVPFVCTKDGEAGDRQCVITGGRMHFYRARDGKQTGCPIVTGRSSARNARNFRFERVIDRASVHESLQGYLAS